MKRFLVFFLIIILMGVFSMDILGKSMKDIQDRMTGQVRYRINVVKGIVESENINKTYNCYIAGETVVYPNIPTFSRNPKLQPGDQVTIEFINGCRETPAILAPEDIRERPDTTLPFEKLIAVIVEQFNNDDYLNFYDLSGNLKNSYLLGNGVVYFETDCMAIDKDNNVYYIKSPNFLTKVDSNGNELLSVAIAEFPESIAIGIQDAYIWTRDQDCRVRRRLITDFSISAQFNLNLAKSYYGLICGTLAARVYVVNSTDDIIEKRAPWGLLASRTIANTTSDSLGLAGDYIVRTSSSGATIVTKIKNTLDEDETLFALTDIDYPHGCGSLSDAYLFVGEKLADAKLYLEKYSIADVLEWSIIADDSAGSPDNSMVAAYPF